MAGGRITIEVGADHQVVARRDRRSSPGGVRLRGDNVDSSVADLFVRWIAEREEGWRRDEVAAFGSVLHRILFPREVWSFIEIEAAAAAGGPPLRLQLSLPAGSALARMPWEYLHVPDGDSAPGRFLATSPRLVLSRYVPTGRAIAPSAQVEQLRVLVVVAQPEGLDPFSADAVVRKVRALDGGWIRPFVLEVPATRKAVAEAVAQHRPHLVQFVGHGTYDERQDIGMLALEATDGSADLVSGEQFAQLLGEPAPPAVLLQACHGATAGGAAFRATAPQLVRHGVDCVVALRYAVRPETAAEFAAQMLRAMDTGQEMDQAVQSARAHIAGPLANEPDLRMTGVPVLYLGRFDAPLCRAGGEAS